MAIERIELFGFELEKKAEQQKISSPVPAQRDDGLDLPVGTTSNFFNYEQEAAANTEQALVFKYREIARYPEADAAISDIVNESFVVTHDRPSVQIRLDLLNTAPSVKKAIKDEFAKALHLLKFQRRSYDIYRQWYVEGRLYYYAHIDPANPKAGIKELRLMDATKVVRRVIPKIGKDLRTGADIVEQYDEFYEYQIDKNLKNNRKLAKDSVVSCPSGEVDRTANLIVGHLDKAIKPFNNLRSMEDSLIVYRIARAPERRIFYVDVGQLPKVKAEQYLRDMMTRYKNKIDYDPSTGEIRDGRKYQAMLEDFWLPRREGSTGTQIETLPGGANLSDLGDVQYFKDKLYQSLNVPISRMNQDNSFQLGRATDIGRDEIKFSRFIGRLRRQFGELFNEILRINLVLKGVCTTSEFEEMRQYISYDYLKDSHFDELKNLEIMTDRITLLRDVNEHVGKYFSIAYVRKNILGQTEEDISRLDAEIMKEIELDQLKSQEEIETSTGGVAWESTNTSRDGMLSESFAINSTDDEVPLSQRLMMEEIRYELDK